MALIDTVMATLHLVVGGLWTGSVLFFVLAVLPIARAGNIRAAAFESVVLRLTMWSRGASFVAFATGGRLTDTRYIVDSLLSSGRGHLAFGMSTLWFVLTGLAEVGRVRVRNGLAEKKIRTPAEKAAPFYLGITLVAVLPLVDAGLLLNWRRPRLPRTP